MKIEDDAMLERFRLSPRCEHCGRPTPQGCDPHHLFKRGMGGGSRLDLAAFLIALPRIPCHADAESGAIKRNALLKIVGQREGVPWRQIEEVKDILLRTPKEHGDRMLEAYHAWLRGGRILRMRKLDLVLRRVA